MHNRCYFEPSKIIHPKKITYQKDKSNRCVDENRQRSVNHKNETIKMTGYTRKKPTSTQVRGNVYDVKFLLWLQESKKL